MFESLRATGGTSAAHDELDLIRKSLPRGKRPEEVRAWWDGLTERQREEYERAVPVDLYDLDGIPNDVKVKLRGHNGYSAVDAVRWAQANWDNTGIDKFPENCANFVSHALNEGGLPQTGNMATGPWRDTQWYDGSDTGWSKIDGPTSSASWKSVDAQKQFFLDHGGQQIPLSEAQPGDVVYWVQQGSGDKPAGEAHHAALITGVTPDGNIHYTQHTDSRLDTSLDGRMPSYQIEVGQQQVVVVRPRRTW
ncbi:amidase domain-containing protein [Kutzneria sp. CA-103260]|uniref:amidase domain-containing protein n=1 Tax=Kutzneria sp. CA-103260 TaxID=2802641 RepID=UPI001BA9915D|nr:amidase domain-containing protein [Kutzneria sp. CA-103260]